MKARRMLRLICRGVLAVIFALGLFAGSVTHYSTRSSFERYPTRRHPRCISLARTSLEGIFSPGLLMGLESPCYLRLRPHFWPRASQPCSGELRGCAEGGSKS